MPTDPHLTKIARQRAVVARAEARQREQTGKLAELIRAAADDPDGPSMAQVARHIGVHRSYPDQLMRRLASGTYRPAEAGR